MATPLTPKGARSAGQVPRLGKDLDANQNFKEVVRRLDSLEPKPADGMIALRLSADGSVTLRIDSLDEKTADAFYEFSTITYPTITDADTKVLKADMPFEEVITTIGSTDVCYVTVRFRDAGKEWGAAYIAYVSFLDWAVTCTPILETDGAILKLYPRLSPAAASFRWIDKATAPSDTEIASGALSTAESVDIHTFTQDGEVRWVGVQAYRNVDGSGDASEFIKFPFTYRAGDLVPELKIERLDRTTAETEALLLIATDDSNQVAVEYREYAEGGTPGTWTRHPATGFSADPLFHEVPVAWPLEGAADKIVEARAIDATGNGSPVTKIRVDRGYVASGKADLAIDPFTGEIGLVLTTDDLDTASARVSLGIGGTLATGAYRAISWADGTRERGTTTFGETITLSSLFADATAKLGNLQQAFVEVKFFRTASVDPLVQKADTFQSPAVRVSKGVGVLGQRAYLGSLSAAEAAGAIVARAVGGDGVQSVMIEIDDNSDFSSPAVSSQQNLTVNNAVTASLASPVSGTTYYVRATPYTESLVSGAIPATAQAGTPMHAEVYVSGGGTGGNWVTIGGVIWVNSSEHLYTATLIVSFGAQVRSIGWTCAGASETRVAVTGPGSAKLVSNAALIYSNTTSVTFEVTPNTAGDGTGTNGAMVSATLDGPAASGKRKVILDSVKPAGSNYQVGDLWIDTTV